MLSSPVEYLTDLKRFVLLHARGQGLVVGNCERVLAAIRTAEGDGPDTWAGVWSRKGDECHARGLDLDACRYYNMARFPYVDGDTRARAHRACIAAFGRWAQPRGIARVTTALDGAPFHAWTNCRTMPGAPLLVVMGGIVSIKEQWGQLLPAARRLGMNVAVSEMPGVGENALRYAQDSWRMLPPLFDALAGVHDVSSVYLIALSFSGHLALRAAPHEGRIRGIATVGAPVSTFFTRAAAGGDLPEVTWRTLEHLTRTSRSRLRDEFSGWALGADELGAIPVPVSYVASRDDEIVPASEWRLLRRALSQFDMIEHPDVHGSPNHLLATRLFLLSSLLAMHGASAWKLRALDAARGALDAGARWKTGWNLAWNGRIKER